MLVIVIADSCNDCQKSGPGLVIPIMGYCNNGKKKRTRACNDWERGTGVLVMLPVVIVVACPAGPSCPGLWALPNREAGHFQGFLHCSWPNLAIQGIAQPGEAPGIIRQPIPGAPGPDLAPPSKYGNFPTKNEMWGKVRRAWLYKRHPLTVHI